ncbi:hypothetical protein ATANTOWER_017289, partial [Ataeniobius toweri]|nr:hypothetical protein [Ataeniobius toweri]
MTRTIVCHGYFFFTFCFSIVFLEQQVWSGLEQGFPPWLACFYWLPPANPWTLSRIVDSFLFGLGGGVRSQSQPGGVCGECDRKCQSESRNPAVVSEESQTSVCNLCGSTLKAPVRLDEHLIPEVCEEDGSHHKDTHR